MTTQNAKAWPWLVGALICFALGNVGYFLIRSTTYVNGGERILIPGETIASKQSLAFHSSTYLLIVCIVAGLAALLYGLWRVLSHRSHAVSITLCTITVALCAISSFFLFNFLNLASSNHWLSQEYLVMQSKSPTTQVTAYVYTTPKGYCYLYTARPQKKLKTQLRLGSCDKESTKLQWPKNAPTKLYIKTRDMPQRWLEIKRTKQNK